MKELRIGKRNATFQHIECIKNNRHKRFEFQELFVEGVCNINLAIKKGWQVKHWIYSDNRKLSDWAREKIKSNETKTNYLLSDELIKEISDKDEVSELMAIFKIKKTKIIPSKNFTILVLDRPSKMGNLGTIIRSSEAFGIDGIIVTGHAVDIYAPEVIRASMGSFFAVNIEKLETNQQFLDKINSLKSNYTNLQIVGTTLEKSLDIKNCDFSKPTILLLGNENSGLNRFYLDICDFKVKIPMNAEVDSLNVGCAASIFMYEIFNQKNNKNS